MVFAFYRHLLATQTPFSRCSHSMETILICISFFFNVLGKIIQRFKSWQKPNDSLTLSSCFVVLGFFCSLSDDFCSPGMPSQTNGSEISWLERMESAQASVARLKLTLSRITFYFFSFSEDYEFLTRDTKTFFVGWLGERRRAKLIFPCMKCDPIRNTMRWWHYGRAAIFLSLFYAVTRWRQRDAGGDRAFIAA